MPYLYPLLIAASKCSSLWKRLYRKLFPGNNFHIPKTQRSIETLCMFYKSANLHAKHITTSNRYLTPFHLSWPPENPRRRVNACSSYYFQEIISVCRNHMTDNSQENVVTCWAPKTSTRDCLNGWLWHGHVFTTKHMNERLTDWLTDTLPLVCDETHPRTTEWPVGWMKTDVYFSNSIISAHVSTFPSAT